MATGFFLPGVGSEVLWTILCGLCMMGLFVIIALLRVINFRARSPDGGPRTSYNNEVCPICISPQVFPVETNCGHKFCGSCLRIYLHNQTPVDFSIFSGGLTCPLCRQEINLLLPNFTQEEMQSEDLQEDREMIETTIREYNIRFGVGPRTFFSYIRDCPVLMRHMLLDFFTMGGVVWMFRVRVILCFLVAAIYLGNPVDFIPEAVFGFVGFLDDMFVFFLCSVYVSVIYRRFVINRGYRE